MVEIGDLYCMVLYDMYVGFGVKMVLFVGYDMFV